MWPSLTLTDNSLFSSTIFLCFFLRASSSPAVAESIMSLTSCSFSTIFAFISSYKKIFSKFLFFECLVTISIEFLLKNRPSSFLSHMMISLPVCACQGLLGSRPWPSPQDVFCRNTQKHYHSTPPLWVRQKNGHYLCEWKRSLVRKTNIRHFKHLKILRCHLSCLRTSSLSGLPMMSIYFHSVKFKWQTHFTCEHPVWTHLCQKSRYKC